MTVAVLRSALYMLLQIIITPPYALLTLAWRQRWPLRETLARGMAIGIPFVLLAGPFFASNLLRYGRLIVDRNSANPLSLIHI